MIPVPAGVLVWLASGTTDMRRGMNSLALQVQKALGRNPHAGDLYVFRGKRYSPDEYVSRANSTGSANIAAGH